MRWSEFREWATGEGIYLPRAVAGRSQGHTAMYGKVLGVAYVGQGNFRSYDHSHQRRLLVYDVFQRTLGVDKVSAAPWDLLDLAGQHDDGYLVFGASGLFWTPDFPISDSGVREGILMVDLGRIQARIDAWESSREV